MEDLPIIPCYESKDCGNFYNCGNGLCDTQLADPPSISNSDYLDCPDGQNKGSCYGNDPQYCNGIQSCCNSNIPPEELICDENNDGFITNGQGINSYIGCDISKSSELECTVPGKESCMEYNNFIDNATDCDMPCWLGGGYDIVKNQCKIKIGDNKNVCLAMGYYCDWDDIEKCTIKKKPIRVYTMGKF